MAARTYGQRAGFGWLEDAAIESEAAKELARNAAALGDDDAIALAGAGFALIVFGDSLFERDLRFPIRSSTPIDEDCRRRIGCVPAHEGRAWRRKLQPGPDSDAGLPGECMSVLVNRF